MQRAHWRFFFLFCELEQGKPEGKILQLEIFLCVLLLFTLASIELGKLFLMLRLLACCCWYKSVNKNIFILSIAIFIYSSKFMTSIKKKDQALSFFWRFFKKKKKSEKTCVNISLRFWFSYSFFLNPNSLYLWRGE